MGHCGKTEPCVDDVYCNCDCSDCRDTECVRPGCSNKRGCNKRQHTSLFYNHLEAIGVDKLKPYKP